MNVPSVNGGIRINDATITGPDVKVANGVLYAIDRLLVPPTIDLNTLAPKSGNTTPATATTTTPTTTPATAAPAPRRRARPPP